MTRRRRFGVGPNALHHLAVRHPLAGSVGFGLFVLALVLIGAGSKVMGAPLAAGMGLFLYAVWRPGGLGRSWYDEWQANDGDNA